MGWIFSKRLLRFYFEMGNEIVQKPSIIVPFFLRRTCKFLCYFLNLNIIYLFIYF